MKRSKKNRKEWWRSLTLDEQVEWRMNWEEERGKSQTIIKSTLKHWLKEII